MPIGRWVRRIAGRRVFAVLGRAYRSIFVDLGKVAHCLSGQIPRGALVLDVGGGDGEPVNRLLSIRPDLTVNMIDLADDLGGMIESRFGDRVFRSPRTSFADYFERGNEIPDVVILLDVVHHVPPLARPELFGQIGSLMHAYPHVRLIVKDIEPGFFRARLSRWSDLYITGDRGVELIGMLRLCDLVADNVAGIVPLYSRLFEVDSPNYMVAFQLS